MSWTNQTAGGSGCNEDRELRLGARLDDLAVRAAVQHWDDVRHGSGALRGIWFVLVGFTPRCHRRTELSRQLLEGFLQRRDQRAVLRCASEIVEPRSAI